MWLGLRNAALRWLPFMRLYTTFSARICRYGMMAMANLVFAMISILA